MKAPFRSAYLINVPDGISTINHFSASSRFNLRFLGDWSLFSFLWQEGSNFSWFCNSMHFGDNSNNRCVTCKHLANVSV